MAANNSGNSRDVLEHKAPSKSGILVNQTSLTLKEVPGDYGVYQVFECYFIGAKWVPTTSRGAGDPTSRDAGVGFPLGPTEGSVQQAYSPTKLDDALLGLNFSFGTEKKKFQDSEIRGGEGRTTVHFPAFKALYAYQRQYQFRYRVWWMADLSAKLWTVSQGSNTLDVEFNVTIQANEFTTSNQALHGEQRVELYPATRRYDDNDGSKYGRREYSDLYGKAKPYVETAKNAV
ncbi:hypothetical protein CTheo_7839 [Ceratobasidium theobromae]|uniref:Uncharacterized protein n=1 Tax=Ceratobasidium theobromae TaxID=1582974 RepID=A0A5N5QBD0_9AGAM|nr:hypothetical protein CTheo_7839 [Ceratobasidium theobromae]